MRSDRRTHQPFDNRGEQHRRYRSTDRNRRLTPLRALVLILVVVAVAALWHTQSKCESTLGQHLACTD